MYYACLVSVLCIYNYYNYAYTSSTAQGGGGRFKDRKPRGEVRLL